MNSELNELLDSIVSQPSLSGNDVDRIMERAFSLAKTPEERREAGAYLVAAIDKRKRPDIDVKNINGYI